MNEHPNFIVDTIFTVHDPEIRKSLINYLKENNMDLEDLLNILLNDFLLGIFKENK